MIALCLFVVLSVVLKTDALSCMGCDGVTCPPPPNCELAYASECSCCQSCAKDVGEKCGSFIPRCKSGLWCVGHGEPNMGLQSLQTDGIISWYLFFKGTCKDHPEN